MGRMCIPRNRALGHEQLMEDYFAEVPTYPLHDQRIFCFTGGDTGSARLDEFSARQKQIQDPLLALYGAEI